MATSELITAANQFFQDNELTFNWLNYPCRSFNDKTPLQHYKMCSQGREEVLAYLKELTFEPV